MTVAEEALAAVMEGKGTHPTIAARMDAIESMMNELLDRIEELAEQIGRATHRAVD